MRMPNLTLPPLVAAEPLDPGLALGVWRLQQMLPEGERAHAGRWYSARHGLAAEQHAAVLVLGGNDQGAGVMLRYADQAGDLARLQHPHIAVPSDSGVTPNGHPYLIIEGEHGRPLLPQLPGLPLNDRIELLIQLCEALRCAHQHGWLLAELDPAMIWRDPQGALRLMGLGLARIPDPTDPFDRGLSLGAAPAFVAPERRAGEPPSLASEVYSLGAFARGLLCGWEDTPAGLAPSSGRVAERWPALPEPQQRQLEALLGSAVCGAAQGRPVGAEAIADELRGLLGQVTPGAHARAASLRTPSARPGLRWWRLGLLLGVALVGVLLALALRDGPSHAAQPPAAQRAG